MSRSGLRLARTDLRQSEFAASTPNTLRSVAAQKRPRRDLSYDAVRNAFSCGSVTVASAEIPTTREGARRGYQGGGSHDDPALIVVGLWSRDTGGCLR